MSWDAFYKRVTTKRSKRTILAFVIFLYINAGINGIIAAWLNISWLLFLGGVEFEATALEFISEILIRTFDSTVFLVMGLLIHIKKSWRLTVITVCFLGFNMLVNLINTGQVVGLALFILGIGSCSVLKKVKAAYANYIKCGILPEKEI